MWLRLHGLRLFLVKRPSSGKAPFEERHFMAEIAFLAAVLPDCGLLGLDRGRRVVRHATTRRRAIKVRRHEQSFCVIFKLEVTNYL